MSSILRVLTLQATRVLVLELGYVVDILVDDDVEVILGLVCRDVGGSEGL